MKHKKKTLKTEDIMFKGLILVSIFIVLCLTNYFTLKQIMYGILAATCLICIGIIVLFKYIKPRQNEILKENISGINREKKQKDFLSPAELEFKNYLHRNLPENIEIHCKVRLADILKTETSYRRIIMMHVDFALFEKNTSKIVLVIELDDKSHGTEKAKERDSIKNSALQENGIPYMRVLNSKKYDPIYIERIIDFCSTN